MLLLGAVILELLLGLVSDGGAYLSRYFNLQRYSYSLPAVTEKKEKVKGLFIVEIALSLSS